MNFFKVYYHCSCIVKKYYMLWLRNAILCCFCSDICGKLSTWVCAYLQQRHIYSRNDNSMHCEVMISEFIWWAPLTQGSSDLVFLSLLCIVKKKYGYPFIPSSLASHKVVIVGVIASPKLRRDQYKDKKFLKKPLWSHIWVAQILTKFGMEFMSRQGKHYTEFLVIGRFANNYTDNGTSLAFKTHKGKMEL